MSEIPWYKSKAFQYIVRQVVVALLLALLTVQGYDQKVVKPMREQIAASRSECPVPCTHDHVPCTRGPVPRTRGHSDLLPTGVACVDVTIR